MCNICAILVHFMIFVITSCSLRVPGPVPGPVSGLPGDSEPHAGVTTAVVADTQQVDNKQHMYGLTTSTCMDEEIIRNQELGIAWYTEYTVYSNYL